MSGEASRPGGDASGTTLERAVDRYHELLAEGDTAAASVAYMREAFERANLIFGGRPLSPSMYRRTAAATSIR